MPRLKQKAPSLDELIGDKPAKKTRSRKASKKRSRRVVAETTEAAPEVVTAAPPADIPPDSQWAHQGIQRNHF